MSEARESDEAREVREVGEVADRLFAAWESDRAASGGGDEQFAADLWRSLEATGLTRVSVPLECGGSGGTMVHSAELIRRAARFAVPVPLAEADWLAGWCFAQAGRALPGGLCVAAISPTLSVVPHGPGFAVAGHVDEVPWGRHADAVVVPCEVDGAPAIVQLRADSYEVSAGVNVAGEPRDLVRARPHLVIDQADVGFVDRALGPELLSRGALARAFAIAGATARIADLTAAYAAEREQFGRPISAFQVIRHYLAEMSMQAAMLASATDAALVQYLADPLSPAPRLAKLVAAESVRPLTELSHQVLGAMGFTTEHPLHRFTTRLWAWRAEYGSEAVQARWLDEYIRASASRDPWVELCTR